MQYLYIPQCVCVHAWVCVWSVISYFQGQISDLRPVNWEWFVQLETKTVSPFGKKLIFGSVVMVRVLLRLGLGK